MANNIVTAKVSVVGTRPMLFHKFGPEALPLEKQEKVGVAGNDPSEWRRTAMVAKNGQLYIDPTYVFGCMREGARYVTKGRGSIMTAVCATLQVIDSRVLLDRYFPGWPCEGLTFDILKAEVPTEDSEAPVYLDIRGVKNPTTKARNVRYRIACSKGWHLIFNIMFDKTVVSRGEMESVAINAGKLVGLGNGRLIGFGRFDIEAFEMQE